ncbi:MAG TPA: ribosomal protein S18-alanine N-acetyltransferase [Spongiibacteraceae bacterium]|jgi:ribosomal-protein-alanine N-acetyltransferase|nr:ribosomal protein S18-alanine N-acetyltransferase [Spongiibacteraceae bacterium]HUH36485.1 ribosomal protein S18-alanine N-acetyltransferase [Spongiibacteraceae bacterium]
MATLEAQTAAFPWSTDQYRESLTAGCCGWSIRCDDHMVGFALFSVVADEASLLNIAVGARWQRRGLGRQLLAETLYRLHAGRGVVRCLLEVRVSNTAALRLYESLGFEVLSRRKNYYRAIAPTTSGGREDALVMQCQLSGMSR